MNEEIAIGIGVSREKKSWDAGKQAILESVKKLNGKKPDLVMLFATIHFKNRGGFKRLLEGAWSELPKGTKVVGGTVTGFIVPQGCFTHGVVAYSMNYAKMDVSIGLGRRTKLFPKRAGKKCGKQIKKNLKNSKYPYGICFEVSSANTVIQIPGLKGKRIIRFKKNILNQFLDLISNKLFGFINTLTQKGSGKEEDVFNAFVKEIPDFQIIGGSAVDDLKMVENYQFLDNRVLSNSVVAIGIKSDLKGSINTTYGIREMRPTFKAHLRDNGRTIHKINGHPAISEFLKIMDWPNSMLDEKKFLRHTFFFPLGIYVNSILYPQVIGWVVGNDILCGYSIKDTKIRVMSSSGMDILESVDRNLKGCDRDAVITGWISSCATRLDSLGNEVFKIREKLLDFFGNKPFLLVYMGGEDSYSKERDGRHLYESFNSLIIQKK